jgi:hypothetical protein
LHLHKPFLKITKVVPMRNHRLDVQATLQHHGHLIPGLEHLSPVNSFDG